jgi:hypothetical protein
MPLFSGGAERETLAEGDGMRHFIGIALAIVMAVVLFLAGTWGSLQLLRTSLSPMTAGSSSLLSDHRTLAALIAVAGTGMLAGILVAAPRISPLAAGLPGLLLLGLTVLYVVSTRHAIGLIPLKSHPYGTGFEAMLRTGILGAAGLAMVIPLFVPSRWRGRRPMADVTGADDFFSGLTQAAGPQAPEEPASDPQAYQPGMPEPAPAFHHG